MPDFRINFIGLHIFEILQGRSNAKVHFPVVPNHETLLAYNPRNCLFPSAGDRLVTGTSAQQIALRALHGGTAMTLKFPHFAGPAPAMSFPGVRLSSPTDTRDTGLDFDHYYPKLTFGGAAQLKPSFPIHAVVDLMSTGEITCGRLFRLSANEAVDWGYFNSAGGKNPQSADHPIAEIATWRVPNFGGAVVVKQNNSSVLELTGGDIEITLSNLDLVPRPISVERILDHFDSLLACTDAVTRYIPENRPGPVTGGSVICPGAKIP